MNSNYVKTGYLCILITAFAFSTMEIVGKMISNQLNPFQMTFLRFLIGGLVLLPFALKEIKKQKINLNLKDFGFFALSGVLNVLVSMSFFQLAVLYTKASVVAVIFSTNFVFTIPFAWLILKEKLNGKMLITLAISLCGLLLIFNPFAVTPDIKGILLAIAAAVTFSFYSVFNKLRIKKYGGVILTSFSFTIGSLLLLIALLIFNIPVLSGLHAGNLPHVAYLGIFVSGIGYLSYFEAMKRTSAITASMVFLIKPALAPLLAFLALGEVITGNMAAGMLCIVAGSAILLIPSRPRSTEKPGNK